ncbi:MAG: class I adenylate-forming enzyme family protein [Nibricoccus sp.]
MPQNLCDLWHANVQHSPEATAVIDGETGRVWSRAALDTASDEWLQAHAANCALEGKRVAVAEPNGSRWLAIFIGLLKRGAIVVPLDSAEPVEARIATSTAAGASALWSNGELRPLNPRPAARKREYCLVKLTSGSTGTPQALLFTHEQMIADGRQVCASMDIRPEDLNLGIIPFGHSYGLGNLVIPLLVQGTPILACASPLPSALAADCARWKPTVFPAVPALLRALLLAEVEPSAIASLRWVISAGAPLAPEIAKAFKERFGRNIHSFYGSSETGGITYDRTGEAALTGRSVGTPMEGVQLEFKRGGRFAVVSAAVMGKGRHSPPISPS